MSTPSSPQTPSSWRKAAPFGCLIASVLLVLIASPPSALVDLLGSDFWARLALGVIVFLCLYLLLIALGVLTGKVVLPFGVSIAKEESKEANAAVLALAAQLRALHESDKELFTRLSEMAKLAEESAVRLEEIERQIQREGRGPVPQEP